MGQALLDHRFIDDHLIAERYLKHALLPEERAAFEAHLVDCVECTDRLLLAEMFRLRSGSVRATFPVPTFARAEPAEKPADQRSTPVWQWILLAVLGISTIVTVPFALHWWDFHRFVEFFQQRFR